MTIDGFREVIGFTGASTNKKTQGVQPLTGNWLHDQTKSLNWYGLRYHPKSF